MDKVEIIKHVIMKLSSGKWIATVIIVTTYCGIMILGAVCCIVLATHGKEDLAEKLFVYIIGNMTGTAVGAVIAYHFKQNTTKEGGTT